MRAAMCLCLQIVLPTCTFSDCFMGRYVHAFVFKKDLLNS